MSCFINCLSKQSKKKMLIIEPLTCDKIFYKKVKRILNGENLSSYDCFAGFHNKRGNHWILFFGDLKKKLFYILDPMEDTEETSKQCLQNWNSFIKDRKEFQNSNGSEHEWSLGNFEKNKQTDSHNCGIIVLLLLENLLKDSLFLNFSIDDLIEYRKKIFDIFSNNSISEIRN